MTEDNVGFVENLLSDFFMVSRKPCNRTVLKLHVSLDRSVDSCGHKGLAWKLLRFINLKYQINVMLGMKSRYVVFVITGIYKNH